MKLHNQIFALLIIPALVLLQTPMAYSSAEGYKKASAYMLAANHKKHPKQGEEGTVASTKAKKKGSKKRDIASVKSKKKKGQKRKVANTKKGKAKKKKKKKKKAY